MLYFVLGDLFFRTGNVEQRSVRNGMKYAYRIPIVKVLQHYGIVWKVVVAS